jgi:hypothetical protein
VVNTFITALEREFHVRNAELLRQPVDGIERTEGWATYAILQLDDAASTWGKHAFPIGGPVETWETFQTKLRAAYKPADSIFQLCAKWQALCIGRDASVTMFNDKFNTIRLELNSHDPQTDLQLLHAYQEKLSGNSAAATTLASYTHLRGELGRPVDLADCMGVIARHDNLVFRRDNKSQATIAAIVGDPQVNVSQGMALGRSRGVRRGLGATVGGRGVGGVVDLGPGGGRGSAIGTDADQCA